MATKKKTTKKKTDVTYVGRYVMVTTERGVFAGTLLAMDAPLSVTLRDARCCLYWPADVRGVLGLAVTGPTEGARVGPPAQEWIVYAPTGVALCSPQARRAWEAAPWGD
jgi:hypothetical protein